MPIRRYLDLAIMPHYMIEAGDVIALAGHTDPLYVVDVDSRDDHSIYRCVYNEFAYWQAIRGECDPGLTVIVEDGNMPRVLGHLIEAK